MSQYWCQENQDCSYLKDPLADNDTKEDVEVIDLDDSPVHNVKANAQGAKVLDKHSSKSLGKGVPNAGGRQSKTPKAKAKKNISKIVTTGVPQKVQVQRLGIKRILQKITPQKSEAVIGWKREKSDGSHQVDEDCPITVIRNEAGGRSETLKISLQNHCVFCLRRITNDRGVLSTANNAHLVDLLPAVPKAEISYSTSNMLVLFNHIWPYLHQKHQENEDTKLSAFLQSFANLGTTFSDLPKMCHFCADKLQHVEKLLKDAMEVTIRLKKTVNDSKFGGKFAWRAKGFERALKSSGVGRNSICETLEVLDNLGRDSSNMNDSSIHSKPSQLSSTFSTVNSSAQSGVPVSFAGTLTNITSTQPALPNVQTSSPHFTLPSSAPVKIQVEGKVEGMDFQEEGDEESEAYEDDSNDSDYIKSEFEDESTSDFFPSDNSPHGVNNEEDSSSSMPADSIDHKNDNHSASGFNVKAFKRSKKSIGLDARMNTKKVSDPNENVTFTVSKDPLSRKTMYTCIIDGCGKAFDRKGRGLVRHQMSKHKDEMADPDPNRVCNICGQTFCDSAGLNMHKESEHPSNEMMPFPVKCDLCKLEVISTDMLDHAKTHLRPIGEEYLLKCPNPICPLVFFKAFSLTLHLQQITCRNFSKEVDKAIRMSRVCEQCGITESTVLKLRAHINATHESATKTYSCPTDGCEQGFTHKQSVFLHLPLHEFRQQFEKQKCHLCKKQMELKEMEDHLRDSHKAEEILKCRHCQFLFSTRSDLLDHVFVHRYSGLFCDICNDNVKYGRHTELLEHYFQVHKIGSKILCEKCDRVFWSKTSMQDHMKRVHEATLKIDRYACDQCNVVFKSRGPLSDHKMKYHGAKPHCCPFCSETFTKCNEFFKHKREHQGVQTVKKEFRCEVEGCGKVFMQKNGLLNHHSSTHLGEKPHVCELCGKSFTTRSKLKTHNDSVHLGTRSHVCDICGEPFTGGNVLKTHKLIHTGERPFVCDICGQRFRHKDVLKRHVESHEKKGAAFKPSGSMKQIRKRVKMKK